MARLQPAVDERRRREAQHPVDQLLVEERQARLHRERHRVAVLVAEQRRQREGLEVGDEPALEVVLRRAGTCGGSRPVVERRLQQRLDRQRAATVGEAPLHQRLEDVARLPRLARELRELALLQQLPQVDVLVGHVPGEQLVATLAVEQHRDLRLGQAHHAPLRVRAGRHDRLVLVPDHVVELVDEPLRRRLRERGFGVDLGEHRVHVLALVDRVAVVDDRERLEPVAERHRVGHVLVEQPARHADDRRRVDAARQARAGGDVGDQATLDRTLEPGAELGRVGGRVGRQRGRPVGLLVHARRRRRPPTSPRPAPGCRRTRSAACGRAARAAGSRRATGGRARSRARDRRAPPSPPTRTAPGPSPSARSRAA